MLKKIKEKLKKFASGYKKPSDFILPLALLFYVGHSLFADYNEKDIKPAGEISYSQYIENINNKNIEKIIIPDYSNSFTLYAKEPIETLAYKRAKERLEKYEKNEDLTKLEKLAKENGWTWLSKPPSQDLEEVKKVYHAKIYWVKADREADYLFKSPELKDGQIQVEVVSKGFLARVVGFVFSLIPTFIMILLLFYFITKMSESGNGLLGEANKFNSVQNKPNVKLEDVAGIEDSLKKQIVEIIDFVKYPEKFQKLNAKKPKGILMSGQPGVGKTMLAKAIANEAGISFFYKDASSLENPYVGMSARTVKNLFKEARRAKNAIIFIDEIDSIGSRNNRAGTVKTDTGIINAMLVEMDGFEEMENVTVIAATNNPEKLDPALLREGRFDRKIEIPLPNVKGREKILKVHAKNKPLAENVDLNQIAKLTIGYSGAELAGIVNEAVILAVRENKELIEQEHFLKARDQKIMGLPLKDFTQSEKQKEMTAYHEAGHAVLSYFLENKKDLYKVSILPRSGSLGVTVMLPTEENKNYNKVDLENKIKVLLGGRIAEEVFFENQSTGASSDIERATYIANKMVKEWGMSPILGMQKIEAKVEREYSEGLLRKADEERANILNTCYNVAYNLINETYREYTIALAKLLMEKEEVKNEEIVSLFEKIEQELKEKESETGNGLLSAIKSVVS